MSITPEKLFVVANTKHGKGNVLHKWDPSCKYLATCGGNRRVHIFDRNGEEVAEFALRGSRQCRAMEWDYDGEVLATLQDGVDAVQLFYVNDKKQDDVELNSMQEPVFLSWSKNSSLLAVGTAKGNLMIFNKHTRKKIPSVGKHAKAITCGCWNSSNQLALASVDRTLTVSDAKGSTVEQIGLRYEPRDVKFALQKLDDEKSDGDSTVSINMDGRTILLYNLNDAKNPVELAFQEKYGQIISYEWFGDGYVIVAFSEGYVVQISTHMKEVGVELQCSQLFDKLYSITMCPSLKRVAACGDEGIRVLDIDEWKVVSNQALTMGRDVGAAVSVEWTTDGQILTVGTEKGVVMNYLVTIPLLSAAAPGRISYLSSLSTVTTSDFGGHVVKTHVDIEPSFLAVGPAHMAVGMNNRAWFYGVNMTRERSGEEKEEKDTQVNERTYNATVRKIEINAQFAAVLAGPKLYVHPIEEKEQNKNTHVFPDESKRISGDKVSVTGANLTEKFVIYATNEGHLTHAMMTVEGKDTNVVEVHTYKHKTGINRIFSNSSGTMTAFVDDAQQTFLYSPVDDRCLPVPKVSSVSQILWDSVPRYGPPPVWTGKGGLSLTREAQPAPAHVFCTISADGSQSKDQVQSFVYFPHTLAGPQVVRLAGTRIPSGFVACANHDGALHGQKASGALAMVTLGSHSDVKSLARTQRTRDRVKSAFSQVLALGLFPAAWELALSLNAPSVWAEMATKAVYLINVPVAMRCYQRVGDVSKVNSLKALEGVEDAGALSGSLCMLLGDIGRAQELFLSSSEPHRALAMRKSLRHWAAALQLAQTLAPDEIAVLTYFSARDLEMKGDFSEALRVYQRAVKELKGAVMKMREEKGKKWRKQANDGSTEDEIGPLTPQSVSQYLSLSLGGIARMTIRAGSIQRGIELAKQTKSVEIMRECAQILEAMSQYNEAARLYAQSGWLERAASIYLRNKNTKACAPLMPKISAPRLHLRYAKAREAERAYEDAVASYEVAKDWASVVRLNLKHLSPQKAFAIVREMRSATGAQLVSQYCVEHDYFEAAIEFMLLANRREDAFVLAEKHDKMSVLASVIGDDGTSDEYLALAQHFEERKQNADAARFFAKCGSYIKALHLYIAAGDESIPACIDMVRKCHRGGSENRRVLDALFSELQDYLLGERTGEAKDLKYLLQLHLAVDDYVQAAFAATAIAAQQQSEGDYKGAHSLLFKMSRDLRSRKHPVSEELYSQLMLIHSYLLVRTLVKQGMHEEAARMLMRVAQSISSFSKDHVVPILTSTVVECQRAGLSRSSHEWASMVMRPEYRKSVVKKYAAKIAQIVRRPPKDEEKDERVTRCPFCPFELPKSLLDCPSCKNSIPYCVTTGQHMVLSDCTQCPSCEFPSLYSAFTNHLKALETCPMCAQRVDPQEVKKMSRDDASLYLRDVLASTSRGGSSSGSSGEQKVQDRVRKEEENDIIATMSR